MDFYEHYIVTPIYKSPDYNSSGIDIDKIHLHFGDRSCLLSLTLSEAKSLCKELQRNIFRIEEYIETKEEEE